MTQLEKVKEICDGEREEDFRGWVLLLLSNIAESVAIIADKTEKTNE